MCLYCFEYCHDAISDVYILYDPLQIVTTVEIVINGCCFSPSAWRGRLVGSKQATSGKKTALLYFQS